MLEVSSRRRLGEMVDEKKFAPSESLKPHERSFLIQPVKKTDKARVPTFFAQSGSNLHLNVNSSAEVITEDAETSHKLGSGFLNVSVDGAPKANAFGKRSMSVVSPEIIQPHSLMFLDKQGSEVNI